MTSKFDYFVVFAEMRTGSNFLETNINAFDDARCHGEAFNPHFIGYPNKTEILGVSLEQRTRDPLHLIDAVKAEGGVLGGFRFFHDHDPRVLETILKDPRCAKIVLTRNPLESYVSLKIARDTGQWKLTDVRRRKESRKVRFDRDEFRSHVEELQEFQIFLQKTLQLTGQTAFYIAYEDLNDLDVINGLAGFLGLESRLEELDSSLKRQNPSPISEKVSNPDQMALAFADLDRFNLNRTPNFEPRRGAIVPSYATGAEVPLLFMPVRSGPEAEVLQWMAALDGVEVDGLTRKHNQKTLRQWRRRNPGNRSFTVVRHPVARAHHVFCDKILSDQKGSFTQISKTLRKVFKIPLPEGGADQDYNLAAHRAAFVAFLKFLQANLAGQTSLRIDSHWASQFEIIRGFGELALPDMIIREDEMEAYLPALALQVGRMDAADPEPATADSPFALADIYDEEIESLTRDAYPRDYLNFGFGDWKG